VRSADGTVTKFDAGPAETDPSSINPSGEITGLNLLDRIGNLQGFVRTPEGTITTFDAGSNLTVPLGINPSGEIIGYYQDARGIHSFLRKP
jgi:hypothetical protein